MTAPRGPSRAHVATMFDGIAHRYDLANRVLSMGLDLGWRRRLMRRLPAEGRGGRKLRLLDVATGTADLAIAAARDERVAEVVGVDVSTGMLAHGAVKVERAGLGERVTLSEGDARSLEGLADFDALTISFGIRNVPDTAAGLAAMFRALAPGGTLLVLEFAEPQVPLFGTAYRLYRRHLLPRIGGAIAGDRSAYRYLDDTIATFPSGDEFVALLRGAGFVDAAFEPLTLGTVHLYRARRPLPEGARV
jgi:demethylmenaquinone methyltransferase/2-methoxy-6-polyprenyl-1,4-benzoquinol methylase